MRVLALWILAFGVALSSGTARAAGTGDDTDSTAATKKADAAKSTTDKASAVSSKTDATGKPAPASLETELQQLRELLEAQSKQLQEQNDALKEQRQEMNVMRENLKAVNAPLVNEGAVPESNPASGAAMGYTANASGDDKQEPPTAIHIKGVTLTPGGFFAAETAYRQRGITNDVNTDLKATPFPGGSNAKLNDLNFSGRQSRISMLVEGKLDDVKIGGYYETDFLSAGVTSNDNQSNSYTLRQRQFWAQAAFTNGFTVTGGQMWSLVTETKKGTENRTEATPLTIDAQYTVGFSWARQYGLRLSKSLMDNKLTLAMSIEGPQTTFGGKIQTQNTLIAAPGDTGGLFNSVANYSYNQTPDFVFKAALDPAWGHLEVFGLVSTFRARTFPCVGVADTEACPTPASFAGNDTRTGGGIGVNARVHLFQKKLDAGIHFLGGDGVGRYGTSGLANVTARPDGTLVPLRAYQALGTLEFHPTPKLDIYLNAGGEYDSRAAYFDSMDRPVGYGNPFFRNDGCYVELPPANQNSPTSPANCQGDIRSIIEGTLGFWYRFYKGPKGTVQIGGQYSYLVKNAWTGSNANTEEPTFFNPSASNNMVFTSFRYYLP